MDRLQKVIAAAGVCSRRRAEALIEAGRVKVNGEVVRRLGVQVDPRRDVIEVDGRRLEFKPLRYYALHKPAGVVSTARDHLGRRTVVDLVPSEVRVYPVGRLDFDTEGLLLLTNDGALAYRLTHPSYEVEKVYEAVLRGAITPEAVRRLREGVMLEDGMTKPARVSVTAVRNGRSTVRIAIHEGRNRQVRRMAEAVGFPVQYLKRVAVGPIALGSLKRGQWRHLSDDEVRRLKAAVRL